MSIRCFAPNAGTDGDGGVVTLAADESHHVSRVLRAGVADPVVVFDGAGREWAGTIVDSGGGRVRVRLDRARTPIVEPSVHVTLAIGLLKGEAMSEVVRDATTLGVVAIVPFVSDHTALPAKAWRGRHADRWARVAVASAKQCRRAVVPRVHDVTTFEAVLGAEVDARLMCVEPEMLSATSVATPEPARNAAPPAAPQPGSRVTLFVGPEGGWSAHEIGLAHTRGARLMTLGPRTLRAEIAPVVALTAVWASWGF